MPKRYFKHLIPDPHKIREHRYLRFLGPILHDPNLLHVNKRSVSGAVSVGLFVAFVPVPFQMLLAAISSVVVRVNLPVAVGVVWVSNPLTMPPMFYFSYKIGAWTLAVPEMDFDFELSFDWLGHSLSEIWEPFLLGCFIMGSVSAVVGGLSVRILWRIKVQQLWDHRKQKRHLRKTNTDR